MLQDNLLLHYYMFWGRVSLSCKKKPTDLEMSLVGIFVK